MNYSYRYSLLLLTIAFSSSWAMETTNSSTQTSNSLQVTTKPKRSKQLEELYQQALKQNPFDKEWWQTLRIMASHPDGGYVCIQDILNYQINPNKTMNNAEYIRLLNSYSDKEVENKVNGFGLSTIKNFFLTINKTSNSEINEKNINHYKALIIVYKRINTLKNDILFSIALSALPEEILYEIKKHIYSNWKKDQISFTSRAIEKMCPLKPKKVLADFSGKQYDQLKYIDSMLYEGYNDNKTLVKFLDNSTSKYKVFSIAKNTVEELGTFKEEDEWPEVKTKMTARVENETLILKKSSEENILITIPLFQKSAWRQAQFYDGYYAMNKEQHIMKIDSSGNTQRLFDLSGFKINDYCGLGVSPNEKLVIINDLKTDTSTILDTNGNVITCCNFLSDWIFKKDSSIIGITEDDTLCFWSPEGKLIQNYPMCIEHEEELEIDFYLSYDEKYLTCRTEKVVQVYDSTSGKRIYESSENPEHLVSHHAGYQILIGNCPFFTNLSTKEEWVYDSVQFPSFIIVGDQIIGWDEKSRSVIEIDYPFHKETKSLLRSLSPRAMMLLDFLLKKNYYLNSSYSISCNKNDHLHKLFLSLPLHLQYYLKEDCNLIIVNESTTANEKLEGKRDRSAAGLDINNNNIAKKQKPDDNASKE